MNAALQYEQNLGRVLAPAPEMAPRTVKGMRWIVRGLLIGIAAYLVFGAGEPWVLLNAPPSVYDVIAAQAQCPGVHNPAPGCTGSPAWTSPSFE